MLQGTGTAAQTTSVGRRCAYLQSACCKCSAGCRQRVLDVSPRDRFTLPKLGPLAHHGQLIWFYSFAACECPQQVACIECSTRRPPQLARVRFAARDSRSMRAAAGLPCEVPHSSISGQKLVSSSSSILQDVYLVHRKCCSCNGGRLHCLPVCCWQDSRCSAAAGIIVHLPCIPQGNGLSCLVVVQCQQVWCLPARRA